MAVLSLPSFADPFHNFSIALDGTNYVFAFKFNQAEGIWYFSLSLVDGTLLAAGVKVVCNTDLLARRVDARLPRGMLTALSMDGDTTPPNLTELGEGNRVRLLYVDADELERIS